MSATAAHPNGGHPVSTDREATERANRKATLLLFAGLSMLAVVAVVVGVIANAVIDHHASVPAAEASTLTAPQQISLYVAPSWKPGPDGERHDAFSKTDFNVKAGQTVRLTIDNRDDAIHSITSPTAGVDVVVRPGTHTYTLTVSRAGRFEWFCAYECDPFSMGHVGYMRGYITAS
jgi:heme/copper-type cytochrome/quinol oxidase subunit 2